MKIGQRLKNAARALSRDNLPSGFFGDLMYSDIGITIDIPTVLSIPSVAKAVEIISEAVAGSPAGVFRENADGEPERVEEHDLNRMIAEGPNEYQDWFTFIVQFVGNYKIYGNGYALITYDGTGRLMSLDPMLPTHVSVDLVRNDEGMRQLVYRYTVEGAGQQIYTPDRVLHIHGYSRGGIVGQSIDRRFADIWALVLKSQQYGINAFKTPIPAAVVQTENDIGQAAADQLRSKYKAIAEGRDNIMVVPSGGSVDFPSVTPDNMQFIGTREYLVAEVARVFNMPPTRLGDLAYSTYDNIRSERISFESDTIEPITSRISSEFKRKLLNLEGERDLKLAFDLSHLTQESQLDRYRTYSIAISQGIRTVDEIRAEEGLGPMPASADDNEDDIVDDTEDNDD